MIKDINIIQAEDITAMEHEFLDESGRLKTVSYETYKKYSHKQIQTFCHKYAFYLLPTTELIYWIKDFSKAHGGQMIEVCAGNGSLGRALNIKMTDSFIQEQPDVRLMYAMMQQPIVQYGKDVKKMDAEKAVKKYKPSIVLASWLTQKCYNHEKTGTGNMYGPREEVILKYCKYYIMIGNEKVHGDKRILKDGTVYDIFKFPYIISRANKPELNCIYVFYGKKHKG